jgi:hypothetical protein
MTSSKRTSDSGEPFVRSPFRGRVHDRFNSPAFIEQICDCRKLPSQPDCEVLLRGRNLLGRVALTVGDGGHLEVVIKQFGLPGVDRLRSLFSPSKALKAWRGSSALQENDLDTPTPIAYLERREQGMVRESYFLSEWIDGTQEIRGLFRELPQPELLALLDAVGSLLARCHRKGILHRDLSDGNILVRRDGDRLRLLLIDTNRIRVKRRVGTAAGIRNLVRLGVPPRHQRYFLSRYLAKTEVGAPAWVWYKANKIRFEGYIRFKKAIRLKKIAQRLRLQ